MLEVNWQFPLESVVNSIVRGGSPIIYKGFGLGTEGIVRLSTQSVSKLNCLLNTCVTVDGVPLLSAFEAMVKLSIY